MLIYKNCCLMNVVYYILLLCMTIIIIFNNSFVHSASNDEIETCEDEKCFKSLLKSRPSLMILFSKSDRDAREPLKLFREANQDIKSIGAVAYINCEKSDKSKKLCKKLKINPNAYELKYYKDGSFNKDYDRQLNKKSLTNFFKDPSEMPWEEDETAKNVVHLSDENAFNKLLKKQKLGILVMFYAPWCGYCKKLKPEFAQAASELKNEAVLAGMNVDTVEGISLKKQFNISGYPTIIYFKGGKSLFNYGGEYTKQGLIDWLRDPQPPKEKEAEKNWAEEEDVHVKFLTDNDFDSFIKEHNSVLVMFYAPWCGHCKHLKPIFNSAAKKLIDEKVDGVIAAVDATKEQKLGKTYKIDGYPKLKYFKNGKFAWDFNERTEEKIIEFMKNPNEPPPPEKTWAEEQSAVVHLNDDSFASFVKTKKHVLAMFYAPWCGHCKRAKPEFTKAAEDFKDDLKTAFVAVDCTAKSQAICKQYEVDGFPTIYYFSFGKNPIPYNGGGREYKDFKQFMLDPAASLQLDYDISKDWNSLTGYEHVNFLGDDNFQDFIKTHDKVLVMFYAPWCGHCTRMKPAFVEAATDLKRFLPGAYLAAVDATKSPRVAKTYGVQGFPSLKYFENGSFKFKYEKGRERDDIVSFMREPTSDKTEL